MAAKKKKPVDEYGLTAKEREFADLYRGGDEEIRGVAWRCYKAVYPRAAKGTCEVEGAKLLKKPQIQAYMARKTEEVSKQADVTVERVLRELAAIGFCDPRKLFDEAGNLRPIAEWDDGLAAAVSSVEFQVDRHEDGSEVVTGTKKVRFWDKNSSLEKLGKHLKMFVDRLEVDPGDQMTALLKEISGSSSSYPAARIAAKQGEDGG